MSSNIMSNSLLNAAAGLLLLVGGFCSSVIVARLLGPEANGTIAFALWLAATGALVAELGTGVMLLRMLPQLRAKGLDERQRRGFAAYLAVPVLVATTLLVALFYVFCWLGGAKWLDATPAVILLIGVLIFVQSVASFAKNYLIGEQRLASFFRLTYLVSGLQLAVVLGGALLRGVEGALFGYIAGQAVLALYTVGILRTRPDSAGQPARALAGSSAVLFLEFVLTSIFLTRSELVFLQHFQGMQDVGFYAVALTLTNLALQVPVQLTGSLLPFYAERQSDGAPDAGATMFAGVIRSFAYLTLPLCFGLAAIAPVLVSTIYGPGFASAGLILAIMAAGAPAQVFIQLVTQYLYSIDRMKHRLAISGLGAMLMVGGCLIAVPLWGGVGAAIVRNLVFLAMSIALVMAVGLPGQLRGSAGVLAGVTAAGFGCGLAAWGVTQALPGPAGLALAIPAGAIAYGVLLRLLAVVPAPDAEILGRLVGRLPPHPARWLRPLLRLVVPAAMKPGTVK